MPYLFDWILPAEYFVLINIGALIFFLLRSRVRPSLIFFFFISLFYFSGLLTTEDYLSNFSNTTVATLMVLILLVHILERTYYAGRLNSILTGAKTVYGALTRMALFVVPMSAFLNNTTIVATLMGVIRNSNAFPASKLLLPLSYMAIMGGMLTLIGTSNNLIVNGFYMQAGQESLAMFDFFYIGAPIAVFGTTYLILFSHYILPKPAPQEKIRQETYFIEGRVMPGSRLIGKSIAENQLRALDKLFLAEIIRAGRLISPVTPHEVIEPGDILIFTGDITDITEIRKLDKVEIIVDAPVDITRNLREVIVSHESELIGRQIKEADFRRNFNAVVVGVKRGTAKLAGKIGAIRLQAGDSLVLAVGGDFESSNAVRKNFHQIGQVEPRRIFTATESRIIIGMFLSLFLLASVGVLSLFKAFLIALIFLLIGRYTNVRELRYSLSMDLLLLIGSALGIAFVMQNSGAASILATALHDLFAGGNSAWPALLGTYVFTLILTELVTTSAAIAIAFPVAMNLAISMGFEPKPFVMTMAYAANASYLTPFGYQTNLMVYAPGNYKIWHYFVTGLPLSLGQAAIVLWLIPVVFPL